MQKKKKRGRRLRRRLHLRLRIQLHQLTVNEHTLQKITTINTNAIRMTAKTCAILILMLKKHSRQLLTICLKKKLHCEKSLNICLLASGKLNSTVNALMF